LREPTSVPAVPSVPSVPELTGLAGSGSGSSANEQSPFARGPHPFAVSDVRETDDSEALGRLRRERAAAGNIEAANDVARALEVLERATGQLSPGSLRAFAERTGRVYSRALARLRSAERRAVRETVRAADGEGHRG
jgi:hypothetical protein